MTLLLVRTYNGLLLKLYHLFLRTALQIRQDSSIRHFGAGAIVATEA